MSQKAIEARIAEKLGVSKAEADKIFNVCIESPKEEIVNLGVGTYFNIRNFGTYTKTARASRAGRNPKTGEPLQIPAKTVLTFKPAKEMNEAIK